MITGEYSLLNAPTHNATRACRLTAAAEQATALRTYVSGVGNSTAHLLSRHCSSPLEGSLLPHCLGHISFS